MQKFNLHFHLRTNGIAMVNITNNVTIMPIVTNGTPAFSISFMLTYFVPYAMATVGSAMGNMNDSEQAIATGIAYIPIG